MPGTWPPHGLPNLNDNNCIVTSPFRRGYNCIAWAAGDTSRWWWPIRLPGVNYWPKGVPRELTEDAFVAAYATVGYARCADGRLEPGIEKIALFAKVAYGLIAPTHAARQLESGAWTSKLGPFEDVSHATLDDVSGPAYGNAVLYLSRRR
jgi:hypothetical protein